jgi:hypothetical protein
LAGTEILRNPPESGGIRSKYRNSCPTGIPAKKSCKSKKNRNSCNPLKNHVPVKNSSQKHRKKRNPQDSCQERFWGPKIKFLKTGITNLGPASPAVVVPSTIRGREGGATTTRGQ